MSFSDLSFIFRFIPIFFALYVIIAPSLRALLLCVGSLVFYAIGDWRFLPLLVLAVIANYVLGLFTIKKNKIVLIVALVLNGAMLVVFKLLGQYVSSLLLPLGISFFTFKMISYQVDLYRGKIEKPQKFINVATYFVMFPQVISGPIMRYDANFKNPLWQTRPNTTFRQRASQALVAIEKGLPYFILGLAMKVLIADQIATLWNELRRIGFESLSSPLAWLGAFGYTINLYFDFWGYSLMAAGLGIALGYPFVLNFDQPYSSASVREFYRRWHVTLGAWFKDYIYIPLGGSRVSNAKVVRNYLIIWAITGFWHGVTFNYILWGLSIFLIIMWERFTEKKMPKIYNSIFGRLHVYILIPVTWIIFAVDNIGELGTYLHRLFPIFASNDTVLVSCTKYLGQYKFILIAAIVLLIPQVFKLFEKFKYNRIVSVGLLVLFWYSISIASNNVGNTFMYFKF